MDISKYESSVMRRSHAATLVRTRAEVRVAQRLAGGLLWLSKRTRADLAYGTCGVASHCARPETSLMIGKRLLRYLIGSLEFGFRLVTTDDVGWEACGATPFDPIVSQTGFAIFVSGSRVMWRSAMQSLLSASTAEAECQALASATQMADRCNMPRSRSLCRSTLMRLW